MGRPSIATLTEFFRCHRVQVPWGCRGLGTWYDDGMAKDSALLSLFLSLFFFFFVSPPRLISHFCLSLLQMRLSLFFFSTVVVDCSVGFSFFFSSVFSLSFLVLHFNLPPLDFVVWSLATWPSQEQKSVAEMRKKPLLSVCSPRIPELVWLG